MERDKTPRDEIWETLADSFGAPRTKTEQGMFGKVVAELLEAGATPEETAKACEYVHSRFDTPSPFAVVKWLSMSLRDKPQQVSELRQLRGL
jgi:endonuclease III